MKQIIGVFSTREKTISVFYTSKFNSNVLLAVSVIICEIYSQLLNENSLNPTVCLNNLAVIIYLYALIFLFRPNIIVLTSLQMLCILGIYKH